MKNLVKVVSILIFVFSTISIFAQVETNLKAQFYPGDISKIYIHSGTNIEYVYTKSELVTLEMNVKAKTRKHRAFDSLLEGGRYDLKIDFAKERISIRFPNLKKIISINKKLFKDQVTLKIYLPERMKAAQYAGVQPNFFDEQLMRPQYAQNWDRK